MSETQCIATTHYNTRCSRQALPNSKYCWQHYDIYNSDFTSDSDSMNDEILTETLSTELDLELINELDNLSLLSVNRGRSSSPNELDMNISPNSKSSNTVQSNIINMNISPNNVSQSNNVSPNNNTELETKTEVDFATLAYLNPDLENIVSEYTDLPTYIELNKYNPKYKISTYIRKANPNIEEAFYLDNVNLLKRNLGKTTISEIKEELLNLAAQYDSINIFKFIEPNITLTDVIVYNLFKSNAFKIAEYITTINAWSRRYKFFTYISILKDAIVNDNYNLVYFLIINLKLNIRNSLNEFITLSKRSIGNASKENKSNKDKILNLLLGLK